MLNRRIHERRIQPRTKRPCVVCVSLISAVGLVILPHVWPQIASIASRVVMLLQKSGF